MHPFEIHYAKTAWKNCPDERPWVIVDVRGKGVYGCFPLSSFNYGNAPCFWIDEEDPDFLATKLTRSCFVHYDSIIELADSDFTRQKGEIEGDMLSRFRDEAGV